MIELICAFCAVSPKSLKEIRVACCGHIYHCRCLAELKDLEATSKGKCWVSSCTAYINSGRLIEIDCTTHEPENFEIECKICCDNITTNSTDTDIFEDDDDDYDIAVTECGHIFHSRCAKRYVASNRKGIKCPVNDICNAIIKDSSVIQLLWNDNTQRKSHPSHDTATAASDQQKSKTGSISEAGDPELTPEIAKDLIEMIKEAMKRPDETITIRHYREFNHKMRIELDMLSLPEMATEEEETTADTEPNESEKALETELAKLKMMNQELAEENQLIKESLITLKEDFENQDAKAKEMEAADHAQRAAMEAFVKAIDKQINNLKESNRDLKLKVEYYQRQLKERCPTFENGELEEEMD